MKFCNSKRRLESFQVQTKAIKTPHLSKKIGYGSDPRSRIYESNFLTPNKVVSR